jgi:hypothetical protein
MNPFDSISRMLWWWSAKQEDTATPTNGVLAQLESFGRLPAGWNFGEGIPVPRDVRDRARIVASFGDVFGLTANMAPGSDGSVALAFQQNLDFVEVTISPDNVVELRVDRGIGFDFERIREREPVALVDVWDALRNLMAGTTWSSQESSIQSTSTQTLGGSLTSLSSHPPEPGYQLRTDELAYQSSKPAVLVTM